MKAANAANGSLQPLCLAPKPPPMRGFTTRTWLLGMQRAFATMRRTWKGTCVEATTQMRPCSSG